MEKYKKQTLNEFIAYMTRKNVWGIALILLLLDGVVISRYIYLNDQGFTLPIIFIIVLYTIMLLASFIYGMGVLNFKGEIDAKEQKRNLIFSTSISCTLLIAATLLLIAHSYCNEQDLTVVFSIFTFIVAIPSIYRVLRLPYIISLLICFALIITNIFAFKGQTNMEVSSIFFYVVIYVSSFMMEFLTKSLIIVVHQAQNEAYEVAETQTNVANELLRINEKLKKDSLTDYLTKLGNRKALAIDTNNFWDNIHSNKSIAISIIDIDNFKSINDIYGHQKGDIVLKRVSQIISEIAISYNGSAYRYGGEEFIMIFNDTNKEQIEKYMDNLSKQISVTSFEEVDNKVVTVSIGTASAVPSEKNSFDNLLSIADKLMYEQKNKKKTKKK